jgi:hypothetical protein
VGSKLLRRLVAPLLSAVLLATASAQYSGAPFFTQPLVQSQAFGLEMALQRLAALEVAGDAVEEDDDWGEVIEGLEADLGRFIGTLAAADADLAEAVEEAVEEVEEAYESGTGLAAAIAEAREALTAAYAIIVPAEVQADPAFVAGLITDMSLGDIGVGEGYEEAIEDELPAYTLGYVALERVTVLWDQIAGGASDQQRADVDEMLEFIGTLYPTPTIDEAIVGNPEEAEAPVHRIIGVLETIVDAELYPGRDMATLAGHLPEQLAAACAAYEAGDNALGKEITIAVGYRYLNADLGDFMEFMAPEVHEEAAELIAALTGMGGEEDDEDGEEGEEDEEEVAHVELADPAAACNELMEALQEARSVFGG